MFFGQKTLLVSLKRLAVWPWHWDKRIPGIEKRCRSLTYLTSEPYPLWRGVTKHAAMKWKEKPIKTILIHFDIFLSARDLVGPRPSLVLEMGSKYLVMTNITMIIIIALFSFEYFLFVLEMKFFGNFKNSIHVMKQWLFDTFGIFENVKFNKNGIRIKSMNNVNLFYAFQFHKNDFSGLSGLGWRSFDDFWTRTTILYISKSRKVRSRVGKFHRCWKCLFLAFRTFQLFLFSNYL